MCICSSGIVSGEMYKQNCILISWDGVSKDTLQNLLETNELKNLSSLLDKGSFVNISITDHFPDTISGHAEMLTGYPPEITGVYKSMQYKEIPEGLTVFERLEENPKRKINTAIIVSQKQNLGPIKGLPFYHAGSVVDYYYDRSSDAGLLGSVASEAVHHFEKEGRFFIFIQFKDAANSGNAFKAGSEKQIESIIKIDEGTGMIINAVKDAGITKNTTIFLTTDTGFNTGQKDNSGQTNIWLISNEPDYNKTGDQKDIAPTILNRMGIQYENLTPEYPGNSLI